MTRLFIFFILSLNLFCSVLFGKSERTYLHAEEITTWQQRDQVNPFPGASSHSHSVEASPELSNETAIKTENNTEASNNNSNFPTIDEKTARKFLNSLSGALNTRDRHVIREFFRFYSDKNAYFIINSTSFKDADREKIENQSEKRFNLEEYIAYIYDIVSKPANYSLQINFENLALLGDAGTYLLTYGSQEQARYRDIRAEGNGEVKVNWRETDVYSRCNITIMQSANPVITGSNCIEKIYKTSNSTKNNEKKAKMQFKNSNNKALAGSE